MILRILLLMFKHKIDIVPKSYCLIIYKKKKGKIHSYNARHCRSLHPAIRNQKQHNYRTFSYHALLLNWNYSSTLTCTNVTFSCFKIEISEISSNPHNSINNTVSSVAVTIKYLLFVILFYCIIMYVFPVLIFLSPLFLLISKKSTEI